MSCDLLFKMTIDLKRSIDLRWFLMSGAIFISDDLVFFTSMLLNKTKPIKQFLCQVWPWDRKFTEDWPHGQSVDLSPRIQNPWKTRGMFTISNFRLLAKYFFADFVGVVNLPWRRAKKRWKAGFRDEHFVQLGWDIPNCRPCGFLW